MRIALATCPNVPEWEADDRPLAEALESSGATVAWVSWDDPAVKWEDFDACLIRTTWDYMERIEEFIAWTQRVASCTQLYHPPGIVRWNLEKTYLRWIESQRLPVLPTEWLAQGMPVNLESTMKRHGWQAGFLKPWIGATSLHTMRFERTAESLAQAQHFLDRVLCQRSMMLQPYVKSVETEGEISAIVIDGEITHGVQKLPLPGDYRVQEDFGARDIAVELPETVRSLAKALIQACPFEVLYARVDCLRDQQRFVINELELIEPTFFFRHKPRAAVRLARALLRRVQGGVAP